MAITDGLWELVASVGLCERTWVGDSDELLLMISDSAEQLVVLDAVYLTVKTALFELIWSILRMILLDSLPYLATPSNGR